MNIRVLLLSIALFLGSAMTVVAWSSYTYYQAIHADDPIDPTLSIERGSGTIIRGDIAIDLTEGESYPLETEDAIETEKASTATITWPDRSITRLGENTRIVIEKMSVSQTYDSIKISYAIKRGKVWNTVIRTLIGDSYFDVTLPKEGIVAGVRGTIFEINLDAKYIHAVEHAITLTDSTKKILYLLPGELVDSENIWLQKGKEWLDSTWNDWNTLSDAAYEKIRSFEVTKRLQILSGNAKKISLDRLMRAFLETQEGFKDIEIYTLIEENNIGALREYSSEALMSFYQKIPGSSYSEDRERLRKVIMKDPIINANIRNSLDIHALWESLDTGKIVPSAEIYLQKKGINSQEFRLRFEKGLQEDTKILLESLSGSIEKVLSF